MKKFDQTGPLYATYYLIEKDGDYEKAILDYLDYRNHDPISFGCQAFDVDTLVGLHRIKGNRESRSHDYPHVLVVNFIDKPNQLIVNFVPKSFFQE